ncbi:molybdopterin-guanine dinucleotide biosynthesis protein A-like protein [Pedosphaera parvula Ellin514]|uniref:Molybdopterin-guanine dinucleotide biosynthesis protein A-like protein n=2 Tax=Pedosphaera TaxID=1032526 RepID=B9XRC4_PEDPL|nr:molybdopterin-guanine dinucleotide biosynthesis protein A-like protein [Pedosphaera parvula Ellin514]
MGRDKSRLKLGRLTMLEHIRAVGKQSGMPVRIIRRDIVPRCGPLGGIYTGLQSSKADILLFVACDMPFLSSEILMKLCRMLKSSQKALFVDHGGFAGFPLLLRREVCLPLVARQIEAQQLSLQELAKALDARSIRPPRTWKNQLRNINTPEDYQTALELITQARANVITNSQAGE